MGRVQENEETLKAVEQVAVMISDKTPAAPADITQAYLMQIQTMLMLDMSKSLAVIADAMEGRK